MTSPHEPSEASRPDDPEDSGGVTVMAPPEWKATASTATARPAPSARSPRVDANVGLVLGGQYRLERAVGHGGTGRVYVATQLSLGRSVAVKILRPELDSESSGEQFAERFFREASLAGNLSHPNIVTVHDYGRDDDGTCFIVMELVEGRSLKELMKSGPIDPERALDLFVQITRGLRHAHRAGLVHRDVKPGNVQVTPGDDGREVAKLLDFGLVKSDLPEVTEITREGSFLGTPHYASPEQVRGQEADARSDLYGLGVMLYRAFTGVLPYYSRNSMALAMSHVRDPYPAMSERAAEVSVAAGHEAIVRRLMQKDASQRYPDADSLLVDLERALSAVRAGGAVPQPATEPVVADSEPSMAPTGAPRARSRAPLVVGLIGLLVLLGVGGTALKLSTDAGSGAAGSTTTTGSAGATIAPVDSGDWSAAVLEDVAPVSLQVALASEPSGAAVWVAGEAVGETPWVGSLAVDDGVHQKLELRLAGYHPKDVLLDPSEGAASDTIALERVPTRAEPRAATSTPSRPSKSRPKAAPAASSGRRSTPPKAGQPTEPTGPPASAPKSAATTTVDGVTFTSAQAAHTLRMANSGAVEAFHGAGIRTQEFNRVKAGRPYRSLRDVGGAPGVGPKTLQRMRDSAP